MLFYVKAELSDKGAVVALHVAVGLEVVRCDENRLNTQILAYIMIKPLT